MIVKPDSSDAPANFAFGEVPVKASVSSSQRATPAELTEMARQIWRRVTESKVAKEDDAGNDRLLESIQGEYKDFNTSFPLVLRWMVQMRKFNAKAFEKYLMKHATAKLDTREAFLELQAEYLVLLYREEHRHPDENYVRQYRAAIVKQLLEEDKTFLDLQKQVEEDLARQDSAVDHDRRQRLYEYILNQKVAREAAASK
jgi:hypothetical protein